METGSPAGWAFLIHVQRREVLSLSTERALRPYSFCMIAHRDIPANSTQPLLRSTSIANQTNTTERARRRWLTNSVFVELFGVINHHHVNGSFPGFQFKADLLLQGSEQCRA